MNRTTLRVLCVAGFALAAASCSQGEKAENTGGSAGGAGGASGAGGAGATGGAGGGGAVLDKNAFGQKYKFADNELAGWTQVPAADDPAAFEVYGNTDELVARIDGAADAYADLRVAMYQDLMGPYPQTCNVVVMDFVTDAKAASPFTRQKDDGASVTIPGYDGSVAIASTTLTGINVYAHFKALYFELWMSGYGSDVTSASQVAKQFLDALNSKTNQ